MSLGHGQSSSDVSTSQSAPSVRPSKSSSWALERSSDRRTSSGTVPTTCSQGHTGGPTGGTAADGIAPWEESSLQECVPQDSKPAEPTLQSPTLQHYIRQGRTEQHGPTSALSTAEYFPCAHSALAEKENCAEQDVALRPCAFSPADPTAESPCGPSESPGVDPVGFVALRALQAMDVSVSETGGDSEISDAGGIEDYESNETVSETAQMPASPLGLLPKKDQLPPTPLSTPPKGDQQLPQPSTCAFTPGSSTPLRRSRRKQSQRRASITER